MNEKIGQIFLLQLTLWLAVASTCHYSCASCTSSSYSHCTSCTETQIETMFKTQLEGACEIPVLKESISLGVILLVISCVSFVLFRSKLLLHMLLSLQLLGLASLVEVAWPTPVRVLLESCQYFMVFNIIARGDKLSAGQLFAHNLSRMQIMLQTQTFSTNMLPLFPIISTAIALSFCLRLLSWFNGNCSVVPSCLAPQTLFTKLQLVLRTFFFLTAQEMLLVSYVSIRFASLSSGDIAIIVCYFIALILFALECTIDRLPYFDNLAQQNLAFLSRLLLPVLVIMPAQLHYSLFIFTGAILLLELLFTKNLPQASSLRQRTLLVRISELACWLMLGIYYVIDLQYNSWHFSYIAGIVTATALVCYYVCLIYQTLIAARARIAGERTGISPLQQPNQSKQQVFEDLFSLTAAGTDNVSVRQVRQNEAITDESVKSEAASHQQDRPLITQTSDVQVPSPQQRIFRTLISQNKSREFLHPRRIRNNRQ